MREEYQIDKKGSMPSAIKRNIAQTIEAVHSFIKFFGRHPFIVGVLAIIGVSGFVLSIVSYRTDRTDAQATTDQVAGVNDIVEKLYDEVQSQKRDWQIMNRAFYGIQVGGPIQPAYKLDFERIIRKGKGVTKYIQWKLPNFNQFSVSYNSEQDRIRKIDLEWGGSVNGSEVGISDFKFGETTLQEIRDRFGSNGFSYAGKVIYTTDEGIVTLNAFELRDTPTIIVVFETLISNEAKAQIDLLPREKQVLGKIGDKFTLVGVSVADEVFLDDEWGKVKIYDPESNPIVLQ
jgi:hypothetical protein